MLLRILSYAALFAGGAYLLDVPVRRAAAARAARAYADGRGMPLLNIGAGTSSSALFGSTLYGDVNVDLCGRDDVPHGTPGVVTQADAHDLSDFEDGSFGAVLASHVLEHLDDPMRALNEWLRVVGGDPRALFVVVPSWWAPHTWLHPGHRWFCSSDGPRIGCRELRPATKTLPACRFMARSR